MKNFVVLPEFEIHTTPLEEIVMDTCTINISLDDINCDRYLITFVPFQAIYVITIDCADYRDYHNDYCIRDGIYHRHILQVENSPMIDSLKKSLTDSHATFLDTAKHFILPLQDNVIHVVSSSITVKKV